MIVAGLAMLIIDFYTPYTEYRDRYSAVFVFFVLFLLARLYFLHSRRDWNEKGATVDPEVGFDMGRSVAISGLVHGRTNATVRFVWNGLAIGKISERKEARRIGGKSFVILLQNLFKDAQRFVAGLRAQRM